MKSKLKPRQRLILEALLNCGGTGTTKEIAQKAKLNTNGVSQTLSSLDEYVDLIQGSRPDRWKLISKEIPPLSKSLWGKLDTRRRELIKKVAAGTVSNVEQLELEDLQKTAARALKVTAYQLRT